jgi:NADPH-dependent curcumin reductase
MDAQTADMDGKRIPTSNRQILLAARPSGEPSRDNFKIAETEIPKPGNGQMLLRTIYLSLDPYMRGRMDPGPSYAPRVEIGQVMVGKRPANRIYQN